MAESSLVRVKPRRFQPRLLLGIPGLIWLLLFFFIPMLFPIYFSFSETIGAGGPNVGNFLSLETYGRLTEHVIIAAYGRTVGQALLGTLCLGLLAFPVAYFLATRPRRWKPLLVALMLLPAWISFLIRTYSWLILLGRGGPVSSALQLLGLTSESSSILFTSTAVWIGILYNYYPLMVLPMWAALERLDVSLLEASSDLGGSPFHTLRHITLPMSLRGIVTATILVFVLVMGEFVIPILLGGQKVAFAGSILVRQFQDARDWAFGSALGLGVVVVALAVTGFYLLVLARALRRVPR